MSKNSSQVLECSPEEQVQQLWYVLDNAWVLLSSFFILMIPVGYTMMEYGFSRPQSRQSAIGSKLMMSIISGILAWWSVGYAFAYSDGSGSYIIGSRGFFQSEWQPQVEETCVIDNEVERRFINHQSLAIWFQQWTVAQIVGVMIISAMSERIRSFGVIVNVGVMCGIATPLGMRWVWSSVGFLSTFYSEDLVRTLYQNSYGDVWDTAVAEGAMDHAGSAVVHIIGGAAGLVGIACIGRRSRFFEDEESDVTYSKGQGEAPKELLDVTGPLLTESNFMGAIGGFFIWIGLLAIQISMRFGLSNNRLWGVSNGVCNAVISTGGAVTAIILIFAIFRRGKQIPTKLIVNSALTGAIAAASGGIVMESYAVAATGFIAGGFYMLLAWCLRLLQVDDPLEIVGVNLMGGWCGMLATGLLATETLTSDYFQSSTYGLFYEGGGKLILVNVITASILTGWGCLISAIINIPLRVFGLLRLSEDEQRDTIGHDQSSSSLPVKPYPLESLELPAQLPDHLPYQNVNAYQSVNAVVNRGSFQQRRSSPIPPHVIARSPSPRPGGRPVTPPYSRARTPDSQVGVQEITLNPQQTRSASAAAMLPPQRSLRRPPSTTPPIPQPPPPIQHDTRY